jgi:hypothetical protein
MRIEAVKLSGKSIVGVLEADSARTCLVSKVAWGAGTDRLFSLTINYYGVSHV